jgi:amino acid transporter
MISRPSETVTAAVGSIIGAAIIIAGWLTTVEVPAEVAGAFTILVSWLAAGVTWFVAQRQRSGDLSSLSDGSVES